MRDGPLPSTQRGSNRWLLRRTNTTRRFGRPFGWIWGRVEKRENKTTNKRFIYYYFECVCTDDFSLLCLHRTKTDKDATKILSIGHKPYGPKTIKPERKDGLPDDNSYTNLTFRNICFRITNSYICFFFKLLLC